MKKITKKEINELAIKVFGSKKNVKLWMSTPQLCLDNKLPLEYLEDITKREHLVNFLNAIEYTVYL